MAKRMRVVATTILALALGSTTAALAQPVEPALAAAAAAQDSTYARASAALDQGKWQEAIDLYRELIDAAGERADAALYWTAYAQHQVGDDRAAARALRRLREQHPDSDWLDDADYLEAEIRGATGEENAARQEEEIRMYALGALMQSAPDRARPLLLDTLRNSDSPEARRQAMYILMQSGDAESSAVIAEVARDAAQDAQLRADAVRAMATFGGEGTDEALANIYASSTDRQLKRAVLEAWMIRGDGAHERLLAIARTESDEQLRADAIRVLASTGASDELGELYRAESSSRVKAALLEGMMIAGNLAPILEVARTEADASLRAAALRTLGAAGTESELEAEVRELLIQAFRSEDRRVREAALEAMAIREDITSLIAAYDAETDARLRLQIVRLISNSSSPEAIEFLERIVQQ